MPYNSNDFMLGRGQYNCEGSPTAPAYHAYTTTETLATVTAASYFPANFNFPEGCVIDNDLIWIHASDGRGFFTVTFASTVPLLSANITPPNLAVTNSASLSFGGPFSGPQTVAYNYVRNGTQITLTFEPISFAFTGASVITSSTNLPAALRPATAIHGSMNVINASVNAPGYMIVVETGQIIVGTYQSLNQFTSGNVGWNRDPITYQLPG
jgi:hypothetical protein